MNRKTTIVTVAAFLLLNSCAFAQDEIKSFTEPYRSIEIAAPEIGTISQLTVKEGDRIKAGTILANLNEEVLAASLAVAQETTQSGGALKSATAELTMQNEKYQKLVGLFQRRHASQTELDRAKSQLEIASAKVESVQDDLRIKTLEMQRIKAQLEQRRLRTPIDGVVTQIFKDEGEFVSPSDPRVMTVVQLNPLRVIFSVPQEQTHRLRVEQKLPVVIGDTEHQGTVEFVSPTADAQSGTCRVKVKIDNSDLKLASGQACFLNGFSNKKTERKLAQTSTRRPKLSTTPHSK